MESSGPDRVYSFTPPTTDTYRFTVTPNANSQLDTVLYLQTACPASNQIDTCFAAVDATTAGQAETLTAQLNAGATYYVFVDGWQGSSGAYSLSVTVPPPGPANDFCANAQNISGVTGPGTSARVGGDTSTASSEGQASCGGGGSDVFYSFTLSTAATVTATVTPSTSGLTPVVSIVSACGFVSSNERACVAGVAGSGATATAATATLQPGTYLVNVDSVTGSSGPFTLSLSAVTAVPPPANDVCASATPLGISSNNQQVTVNGTTVQAASEYVSPSCGGQSGDVYYALHLNQTSNVTAALTQPTTGPLDPVIDLLNGCGGTELGCFRANNNGESGTLSLNAVPAGDYILVVDSIQGTSGPFTLQVSLTPPPPPPANDACPNATDIPLNLRPDGGYFGSAAIDASGATDQTSYDPSGACFDFFNPTVSGVDVVYHVTVPAGVTQLSARYVLPSGQVDTTNAAVFFRQPPCINQFTDGGAPAELSCGYGSTSAAVVAGDYYLWVDQVQGYPVPVGNVEVTSP
jgi:hypothetical protein